MHIVFQFPVVDLRIVQNEKSKLTKPNWSSPGTAAQAFVRKFGKVLPRYKKGLPPWPAEENFCKFHVLKFRNLHENGFGIRESLSSSIFNSYRRLYSDGKFMNKIEVGFIDNTEKLMKANPEVSADLFNVLKHYANLPVMVNQAPSKLFKAGKLLARNYCDASTPAKKIREENQKYVVSGDPVILIFFTGDGKFRMPRYAKKISQITDEGKIINLFGYQYHQEGYYIKVWLIELPAADGETRAESDLVRKLRINLLRIHAEKETVRILLGSIGDADLPDIVAKSVSSYLKGLQETLFKKSRFDIDQSPLLQFALHSESGTDGNSLVTLESQAKLFEDKYLQKNTEKFARAMAKDDKLLLLFVTGGNKNQQPFDFGKEYQAVQAAHDESNDKGNFSLEIRPAMRKENFAGILEKYQPAYLHLTMHGSKQDGLYFNSEGMERVTLSADEFNKTLKDVSDKTGWKPEIIILNACNSKPFSDSAILVSDFAVGMKTVWPDIAGTVYTGEFYKTLFGGNQNDFLSSHQKAIEEVSKMELDPYVFEPPATEPWLKDLAEIEIHNIPEIVHSIHIST